MENIKNDSYFFEKIKPEYNFDSNILKKEIYSENNLYEEKFRDNFGQTQEITPGITFQITPVSREQLLDFVIDGLKRDIKDRDRQITQLESEVDSAWRKVADRDARLAQVADVERTISKIEQRAREAMANTAKQFSVSQKEAQEAKDEAGRQKFRTDKAERMAKLAESRATTAEDENSRLREENSRLRAADSLRTTKASTGGQFFQDLGLHPDVFSGCTRVQAIKIVETMRRTRAQFVHPDLGGSNEDMKKINNAADALKTWCEQHLS